MAGLLACGLYCGSTQDKFSLTSAGSPGVALGTAILGRRALEFDTTTTAGQAYAQYTPPANVTTFSFGIRVKLSQLPSALSSLAEPVMVSGTKPQVRIDTDGTIRYRHGTGAATAHPTVLQVGVETWIDIEFDVSSGTHRIKVSVDTGSGRVDGTDSTLSEAPATMSSLRFGNVGNTTTVKHAITDIVIGDATTDFPWGYGKIHSDAVSSDGTHSFTAGTPSDFQDDAGTNLATNATTAYQKVDDATMPAAGAAITAGDFLAQAVIRSTGYLEFVFPTSGEWVAPTMVTVTAAVAAASAATCTYDMKVNDGGTLDAASHRGRFSPAETTIRHGWIPLPTRPNGGGSWTLAAYNALRVRWGYATDVTPNPRVDSIIREAFVPVDTRTGTTETGAGADASTAPTASSTATDTAAGADSSSETATAAPTAEAGAGADASTAVTASLTATDAATAVEGASSVAQAATDAATGDEPASSLTAALTSSSEAAAGDDAANVAPATTAEAGTGADASTAVTASTTATDAAVGADASVGIAQPASEAGAGTDASTLQTADSRSTFDQSSGSTDAASLAAAAVGAETLAGADSSSIAAAYALDDSLGFDDAATSLVAVDSRSDAATASDTAIAAVAPTVTDAGAGVDVSLVVQLYAGSDDAVGLEEPADLAPFLAAAELAAAAEHAAVSQLAGVYSSISTARPVRPSIRTARPVKPLMRSTR